MNELTVQMVYDILKQRIAVIEHLLSENCSFQITSNKLRIAFNTAKQQLQGYVDDIDSGVHGNKEDAADNALNDLYNNVLCPDKKE